MDENKDILLELAKQLISEEEIKSAVWKVVADRVDYHVSQEIGNIVRDIIHEKTEGYIREMVDDVLSQPVKTDDGWGRVEKYDSFEAFVKEKIKDKSYNRSAWDIQTSIRKYVEEKIRDIAEKLTKKESKDRSEEILKELASEYANGK